MPNYYRPEIDGLRAIAVVSVILFHAEFTLSGTTLFQGGYIGVDVFFVISGYLITLIIIRELAQDKFSLKNFYERRARRIMPILLTVTLLTTLAALFLMPPQPLMSFSLSAITTLFFSSNIYFFLDSNYWAEPSALKPLLHTWSLAVEEQFYILYPFMLIALWRYFKNHLVFILGLITITSLGLAQYGSSQFIEANFYLLPSRGWELMAGAILAHIELTSGRKIESRFTKALPILGFVFIICAVLLFDETTPHPSLVTLLPVAGTMLLIWFSQEGDYITWLLSRQICVRIGLLSYSLYMWHFPLFAFSRLTQASESNLDKFLIIMLTTILSSIGYIAIERRARIQNKLSTKLFLMIVVTASLIILILNVYALQARGSLTGSEEDEIAFGPYDYANDYLAHTCFLEPDDMSEPLPFKRCTAKGKTDGPTMLLWGDSHAAHLIPGLIENFADTYNIIIRTSSDCRPILNRNPKHRPFCKNINDNIFQYVKETRPSHVLIAGRWQREQYTLTVSLIKELKRAGVKFIYVVGPVPHWSKGLPIRLYQQLGPQEIPNIYSIPQYLLDDRNEPYIAMDQKMQEFFSELDVTYISPISILCRPEKGCLTYAGDKDKALVQWDSSHLTRHGSSYLVRRFEIR